MEKSRVLIILDDEWMSALLERYLTSAGFEVSQSSAAKAGFAAACETTPDCIICDEELPDIDGFWVIQRVRAETGRVSQVPILLLTEDLEALQESSQGADLFLKKPLNNDEVAVQIRALLNMAQRLRQRLESASPPASAADGKAALRGDIAQMSVTTVLTVLEMERRTGELTVQNLGSAKAEFRLAEGSLTAVRIDDKPVEALDALRLVLGWTKGRFWFSPSVSKSPPGSGRHRIGMLLLEAARLQDESNQ